MTLLERLEAPQNHATISQRLWDEMATVPGARGLAISQFPSGTRGILVIDAEETAAFLDAEAQALASLVAVRRTFPDSAIDLLCVNVADAGRFNVPPEATVYSFA